MKKNLNEELKDIKYLFNYDRGRVISEQQWFEDDQEEFDRLNQKYGAEDALMGIDPREVESMYSQRNMDTGEDLAPSFNSDGNFLGMVNPNRDDMEFDEDEDLNYLKNDLEENEIETPVRPGIKTPTKPKKPKTPYSPKPGPKPDPKARKRKGDMPTWLTFDELGIEFE